MPEPPLAAATRLPLPHAREDVPEGSHVVAASRLPPPPTLARLRLNGVIEPDAQGITPEEAPALARARDPAASPLGSSTAGTQRNRAVMTHIIDAVRALRSSLMPVGSDESDPLRDGSMHFV